MYAYHPQFKKKKEKLLAYNDLIQKRSKKYAARYS